MKRTTWSRKYLASAALCLFCAVSFEAAPFNDPPRVGVIFNTAKASELNPEALKSAPALAVQSEIVKAGFKPGQSVHLYWRSIESDWSRYGPIVDELLALKVDVLVISGNDDLAKEVGKKAPNTAIVVAASSGTDALGLESLRRPGGNITGVETHISTLKMMEMLKELVPNLSRVAFLGVSQQQRWGEVQKVSDARKQSSLRDLVILNYSISAIDQVESALEHAKQNNAQAVIVCCGLYYLPESQRRVHAAVEKHKLPAIHWWLSAAETGGLAAYGIEQDLNFRKAGWYVARILKGAKPGELPVERLDNYKLYINRNAAKAIGLSVPPLVLLRADKIFE